jgi:OmpA-OmpF porin, OOP family
MKKINLLLWVFLIVTNFSEIFAQSQYEFIDTLKLNSNKLRGLAQEAERTGNIYTSLYYYEELLKDRPTLENQYKVAQLYMHTRDYNKAAENFQSLIKSDAKNNFPAAHFYLGKMLQHQGKHEEALSSFNNFKKQARSADANDKELLKKNKQEIASCEYAIKSKNLNSNHVVNNLGSEVNFPHIEFSPIPISDNQIIFGTLRTSEVSFYSTTNLDTITLPLRKFHQAKKVENNWVYEGEWKHPSNNFSDDVGNGCFSLDSNRFYFTICKENWQYKIICKIYYVEKKGKNSWSEPVLMDENINMPNFSSSHPTIGRETKYHQEVLYFASNRPKSKGGYDIWYAEYHPKRKTFKSAKNAGRTVNTEGDELTPYYDAKNKTLYFASNGWSGFGGLDIFKIEGETKKWEESPTNLLQPINSFADDLDFALKPSGKGGFLVSNRTGGQSLFNPTCCDDIYEIIDTDFIEIDLYGAVLSKDDISKIENEGVIKLYLLDKEGEKYLAETIKIKNGSYAITLQQGKDFVLESEIDGFFNSKIQISTKEIFSSEKIKKDIFVEKIPSTPIVLKNVTYEFDSPKLTETAINTIDTTLVILMKNNPEIVIEISSHTDSKGSDNYNLRLSQKRAESVVKHLKKSGIPEQQTKAKGYGASQPIAPNTHPDGSDNPEGRAINRRTEFRIIGKIDPTSNLIYDED